MLYLYMHTHTCNTDKKQNEDTFSHIALNPSGEILGE